MQRTKETQVLTVVHQLDPGQNLVVRKKNENKQCLNACVKVQYSLRRLLLLQLLQIKEPQQITHPFKKGKRTKGIQA